VIETGSGSGSETPPETPPDAPLATSSEHRAGYVALVGRPNVGKSTLLNRLLDHKLSIVTPAPQTTRQRVLGILSRPSYQIVFFDTPGILEPRYALQQRMVAQAMAAVSDADVLAVLLEARTPLRDRELELAEEIRQRAGDRPRVVILNKIDRIAKPDLLPLMARVTERDPEAEVVPISALRGDGVARLEAVLAAKLPIHPAFYPDGQLSDKPERFFAAELVREKVFRRYREEVPYGTAVRITAFEDEPGRAKVHVVAEIIVERESQKGILIGAGGRALKLVGQEARADIEAMLGRPVYLELEVVVRRAWRRDERFLAELGL
jgi:GTP-binding protein Era